MISAGFAGQLVGALLSAGSRARTHDRDDLVDRLFAVMSLVCALAWDYNSLLVFRTIQGHRAGR